MSDGAKIVIGIIVAVVVILAIGNAVSKAGEDCAAKGGTWTKNPGSAKTGYHCVMPK